MYLVEFCKQTLDVKPQYMEWSLEELIKTLVETLRRSNGYVSDSEIQNLNQLIASGFLAVLIEPGDNVTMTRQHPFRADSKRRGPDLPYEQQMVKKLSSLLSFDSVRTLMSAVAAFMDPGRSSCRKASSFSDIPRLEGPLYYFLGGHEIIAHGDDCCVLYPTVLDDLSIRSQKPRVRMQLQHGSFILNGRAYKSLEAIIDYRKPTYYKLPEDIIPEDRWPLKPVDNGGNISFMLTATERTSRVALCFDARIESHSNKSAEMQPYIRAPITGSCIIVDLANVVERLSALEVLLACEHDRDTPLPRTKSSRDAQGRYLDIIAFDKRLKPSVGPDIPKGNFNRTVTFAMTKDNPEAQLLVLDRCLHIDSVKAQYNWRFFLQGNCCMACALERLKGSTWNSLVLLT